MCASLVKWYYGIMPKSRTSFIAAVHVFVWQNSAVLLLQRQNTGYCDGMYSVPAGHVEADESVVAAAQRELAEETGLVVELQAFELVHVMNRRKIGEQQDRIDFFFRVQQWHGKPVNAEPDKCSQLRWVNPKHTDQHAFIPYVQAALSAVIAGEQFSQFSEP